QSAHPAMPGNTRGGLRPVAVRAQRSRSPDPGLARRPALANRRGRTRSGADQRVLRGLSPRADGSSRRHLSRKPRRRGTAQPDCRTGWAMSVATDYAPVLLTHPGRKSAVSLDEYRAEDGYVGWKKALTTLSPEQVVEEVKASGLRGRGGAGFPTGMKWSFIPKAPGAKYVAVNADESEHGTFKDRELIEVEPHRVLEGVALCCYAIGADTAFIYIRGEYVESADRLEAAIAGAEAAGVLGQGCLGSQVNVRVLVFRGAGAYICGEETAPLESPEGRRPTPRS